MADNNKLIGQKGNTTNGVAAVILPDQNQTNCVRSSTNCLPSEKKVEIEMTEPPDGGIRAWLVMISAFTCVGLIFGVINTCSIIYLYIQEDLVRNGVKEASSKAALIGSLTIGMTFLLSPISGVLTDKIGIRLTTLLGGFLTSSGMLLSSFCITNVTALYFTYGVFFGLGAAFTYTPSLAILGHYFKRYIGIVNGIVTSGSSVFTAFMPLVLKYFIHEKGLSFTLRFQAVISCFIIFCALMYKPRLKIPETLNIKELEMQTSNGKSLKKKFINVENWNNKRYLIWVCSFPLALFGYFVPYVHLAKFVTTEFPGEDENLPIICLAITSGLGRVVFGFLADMPGVNRIFLQQLALALIGLATMLMPLTKSFTVIIIFVLAMGLFDGCFISMIGPIAIDICGPDGASQAIGFLFGLCSLPLTIGPPLAGMLYDHTGSYRLPFILSGISPIVSAILMCSMRFVKDTKQSNVDLDAQQPLAAWNTENGVKLENAAGLLLRDSHPHENGDSNHHNIV